MFAGAAREAVFSSPDVIKKVNAQFVPVALKAGLVNNPGFDAEGRLYAEIGRSRLAPQGICVANSSGKALDWALMFDDDTAVVKFLERAVQQYQRSPEAAVATERYMRFPSQRADDMPDSGWKMDSLPSHSPGDPCRAAPPVPPGTLVAKVYGRALGADGKPVADTRRQESYIEDRLEIPLQFQELLARAAAESTDGRFAIPEPLAQILVGHAYLGQLDVSPLGERGVRFDRRSIVINAVKETGVGSVRLRISGVSDLVFGQDPGDPISSSDGRQWGHAIKLNWTGIIEMKDSRIARLLLSAEGDEKLKWGNPAFQSISGSTRDVFRLPAGHFIDQVGKVRYGIIAESAR